MLVVVLQNKHNLFSKRLYVRTALIVAAFPFFLQYDTIKRPALNKHRRPICDTLSCDVFAFDILKKFEEPTNAHRFLISCPNLHCT